LSKVKGCMDIGYSVAKRALDFIVSIFAIILLIIPWLIICIVIKKQSPGPVLFKPERVGKNGKIFRLYKFRSMRTDSGVIHGTTLRGDSRVFPFGAFLRKSKLDESPQFLNILFGDMSLIGPRPEDKVNAEKLYKGKYKEILSVLPGLSSPASLYDYTFGELYSTEDDYMREFEPVKLDMEIYYIRNRNFLYDIEIIFRTVVTIIQILIGKKNFKKPKEISKMYNEVL